MGISEPTTPGTVPEHHCRAYPIQTRGQSTLDHLREVQSWVDSKRTHRPVYIAGACTEFYAPRVSNRENQKPVRLSWNETRGAPTQKKKHNNKRK